MVQNIQRDETVKANSIPATEDLQTMKDILDQICLQIARTFNLYASNGKLCKALIIDTIAESPCLACIVQKLSAGSRDTLIDDFYRECHKLAVNCLIEELHYAFAKIGYNVVISSETELDYGRADVIISVTKQGINLKCKSRDLLIEVKTGNSLSFSQLFRYLLDGRSDSVIVWRVRKSQVLVFNVQKFKPLLAGFIRMICLRAKRLLSSQQIQPCQHAKQSNHQPSQEELEKAFKEFSEALVETLPAVLQTVLKQLEDKIPKEST
jgi:hypothetical protein